MGIVWVYGCVGAGRWALGVEGWGLGVGGWDSARRDAPAQPMLEKGPLPAEEGTRRSSNTGAGPGSYSTCILGRIYVVGLGSLIVES